LENHDFSQNCEYILHIRAIQDTPYEDTVRLAFFSRYQDAIIDSYLWLWFQILSTVRACVRACVHVCVHFYQNLILLIFHQS